MTEEYIIKPVSRTDDALAMATIQYDSFNDPNNTTPDEMSILLEAETQALNPQPASRQERIQKTMQRQQEFFNNPHKYQVIGIYSPPSSSASSAGNASLELAGFAVWCYITPSTPPDSIQTDKKEHQNPTLLNRFFAQMNRTREQTMKHKSYLFLKLLSIHPTHQRKGLGTKLLTCGLQNAQQQALDTYLESSPMGKGTYLKAGFTILGIDRIEEKSAKNGYLEWPFMIHKHIPSH